MSQLRLNADNLKDFISLCNFLENNSLFDAGLGVIMLEELKEKKEKKDKGRHN